MLSTSKFIRIIRIILGKHTLTNEKEKNREKSKLNRIIWNECLKAEQFDPDRNKNL